MNEEHIIKPGECLTSLAAQYGRSEDAIWNHPRNAHLRKTRPCRNVLNPGDAVFIPNQEQKFVSRATGQAHEFVISRSAAMLKIRLQDREGKPFSSARYVLQVSGQTKSGITSADGLLQEEVPARATSGNLSLSDLGLDFPLQIGHLDPITETDPKRPLMPGVQSRLQNLGFYAEEITAGLDAETQAAVARFQHDILGRAEADGLLDSETQDALTQKHGC